MLIDLEKLVRERHLNINGVLHVGAHLGEEGVIYSGLGIENVWWIEGNADNIGRIQQEVKNYGSADKVICALITDKDDEEVTFNITNYDSMSSSVFEFGTHPNFSPDTVFVDRRTLKTSKLDTVVEKYGITGVNFLNMDLQGAELLALRGAEELIKKIDYVYTEVNCDEVYIGCAQVGDLDVFLSDFVRVETGWVGNQGWGDALYVRKGL